MGESGGGPSANEFIRDHLKQHDDEIKDHDDRLRKVEIELALVPVLKSQFNRLAVVVGTVGTGLVLAAVGIILKGGPS